MSERPATATGPTLWGGWRPSVWTPWGKGLWGTTIDYGGGATLVISKDGIGRFTDPSGESGTWNPAFFGWQDEDGTFKDATFGLPGMEWTPEQLDTVVESLAQTAEELQPEQPEVAEAMRDRAKELWDNTHDNEPYPYD